MSTLTRTQRKYDHRLRELVQTTGSIDVAVRRGVPRSTAYGWLNKAQTEIVTLDVFDKDAVKLQHEVITLRRRNARLIAVLRLLVTVLKVTGFSLSRVRLPEKSAKRQRLRAVKQARDHFPLRTVLGLIGLTHGRFHSWKQEACGLNDLLSCPKSSPQQLTGAEVSVIREMITSDEYRHVPTGTLARLAQRLGKVFGQIVLHHRDQMFDMFEDLRGIVLVDVTQPNGSFSSSGVVQV